MRARLCTADFGAHGVPTPQLKQSIPIQPVAKGRDEHCQYLHLNHLNVRGAC